MNRIIYFLFQAEDGIRDGHVTGVQTVLFRSRQRLAQHDPSLMKHQLGKIAQLEHMFADALATRMGVEVDEDIFPELLAAMAVSMIRVAIRRWVANEEQPLYELIDTAFQQCQRLDAYNAHVLPAS